MFDVLIIGAGISGLTAAFNLKEKGKSVAVFDKGNGVGGRTATRKLTIGETKYAFDYGCPEFELTENRAMNWFLYLKSAPEFPKLNNSSEGRHFEGGMRSFSEWLADSVADTANESRIFSRTKITNLGFKDDFWTLSNESQEWKGKHLIITIPAPQAIELLHNSDFSSSLHSELHAIRYQPSWAVLTTSERKIPQHILADFLHFDPDLKYAIDNHSRGVSNGFAYNFHYAESWSRDYLEATFPQVEYDFIRRWNRKMSDFPLQTLKAHRWRYAFPIIPPSLRGRLLTDETCSLMYGSDALFSPNVEGAIQAGLILSDWF